MNEREKSGKSVPVASGAVYTPLAVKAHPLPRLISLGEVVKSLVPIIKVGCYAPFMKKTAGFTFRSAGLPKEQDGLGKTRVSSVPTITVWTVPSLNVTISFSKSETIPR